MKYYSKHIIEGTSAKPKRVLLMGEYLVNASDYDLSVQIEYIIKENSYILTYGIFDNYYSFKIPNMSILIDFFNKANTILDENGKSIMVWDLSINLSIYLRDNYSEYWIKDDTCLLSTIEELHKMANKQWEWSWSNYSENEELPDYVDRSTPLDNGREYLYDSMYRKKS